MEQSAIGRQLRARRTAAGRTVASVAADASLSVPYIANLENGRGNPTITALTRLAEALGLRLEITLVPDEEGQPAGAPPAPVVPAALIRLGRTERFRQAAATTARALGRETDEYTGQLVAALAAMAPATGQDLSEADLWRVMDALLLIATYPAGR